MQRGGYIYILTNNSNKVLYVGVTSKLYHRIYEHKNKVYPYSFSAKYNIHKLVYYEGFSCIEEAIYREKQLKAGSRKKKLELVNAFYPSWEDLFEDVLD